MSWLDKWFRSSPNYDADLIMERIAAQEEQEKWTVVTPAEKPLGNKVIETMNKIDEETRAEYEPPDPGEDEAMDVEEYLEPYPPYDPVPQTPPTPLPPIPAAAAAMSAAIDIVAEKARALEIIKAEMQKLKEQKKMDTPQIPAPVQPKYYAMYSYDTDITAVGPFSSQREARCFAAGIKEVDNDDFRVLGVVQNLVGFDDVNIKEPDLGK